MSGDPVPDLLQPGPITPPPLLPTAEEIRETCGDGLGAAMLEAGVDILRESTRSAGPVRPDEEPTT